MADPLPPDSLPIQRVEWLPDLGLLIRLDGDPALVWLLDGMPRVLERCVLAHELRHAADPWPVAALPPLLRAWHEEQVDRDAARHLVPAGELAAWLAERVRSGDPVGIDDVAQRWEVTARYAALVLAAAGVVSWADVPARGAEKRQLNAA